MLIALLKRGFDVLRRIIDETDSWHVSQPRASPRNGTHTSSCTLTKNCYIVGIATKSSDALLDPLQGGTLVKKCSVRFETRSSQFI